jgi:hypothetical protein
MAATASRYAPATPFKDSFLPKQRALMYNGVTVTE